MNPNARRRIEQRDRARKHALREAELASIHASLLAGLQSPHVQESIDRAWQDRAEFRAARDRFESLGGLKLVNRIHRLYMYTNEGTSRERGWLLEGLSKVWSTLPVSVLQDSTFYDIPIKVRSLKAKSAGSNPYEWKRADKLSVDVETAPNASRARVRQVGPASLPELTAWYRKATDAMFGGVDEHIAHLEDIISRAQASGAAHARPTYVGKPKPARPPRWSGRLDHVEHVLTDGTVYRQPIFHVYKDSNYHMSYPSWSHAVQVVGQHIYTGSKPF
jgi:hypothetical protein